MAYDRVKPTYIIIINIIITIIIIIIVTFMQVIHTHIPETNHVPRGYIVAAILSLLFMVPLFLVPALALLFSLRSHFPQYVCRAQYGCFQVFLDVMVSWYVAHVFSE